MSTDLAKFSRQSCLSGRRVQRCRR